MSTMKNSSIINLIKYFLIFFLIYFYFISSFSFLIILNI